MRIDDACKEKYFQIISKADQKPIRQQLNSRMLAFNHIGYESTWMKT